MPDGGPTAQTAVTDLWSRMPTLMMQAYEQGITMEVEIANAVITAMREINTQQLELMKAVTTVGTKATAGGNGAGADQLKALGDTAQERLGAIAQSLGECSRRIFEANQTCLMRSLDVMTGTQPAARPAKPAKPMAH